MSLETPDKIRNLQRKLYCLGLIRSSPEVARLVRRLAVPDRRWSGHRLIMNIRPLLSFQRVRENASAARCRILATSDCGRRLQGLSA